MKKVTAPLITVIIPAFNAQASIERAVKSVLDQTSGPVELIVVNDCSSDNTQLLLQNLEKEVRNLRVISNKFNKGAAAARNQGIDAANGEWITFLDADDYFDLKYIEAVQKHLQKTEFICTSYVETGTSGEKKHKNHELVANIDLHDKALLNYLEQYYLKPYQNTAFVHCWNKFFLKNLIDEKELRFNEGLSQLEDVDFVFRFLYHSNTRQFLNIPGVFHQVDKLGSNLSNYSGLEENSFQKLVIALNAPKNLKKKLLVLCREMELVPFEHFFCSMVILFCIRISRQIWQTRNLALFRKLWYLLSHPETRKFARDFRYVEGESKVLNLTLRYLPVTISSIFLIFLRR
jgi:glycosyltransferase involved in cell wall biosynthesis